MYKKKFEEQAVVVSNSLLLQKREVLEEGLFMRASTRINLKQAQPNQIREAMKKGYVEMSSINLSIASEYLHVEYEAQHTVERLVSGG